MKLRRELMIARLAAAHRQGRLVPFLGAGMSIRACPSWGEFIGGLERQVFGPDHDRRAGGTDPEALIRRANAAVRQLRLRGEPPFAGAVSEALKVEPPQGVPAQTKALAQLYWPLVLTSNYDDLFLKAWNDAHAGTGAEMEVLGRSPADCRHVLTSLHASRPPILWALQGYVGDLSVGGSRHLLRFLAIDQAARKAAAEPSTRAATVEEMTAKTFEGMNQARATVEALVKAKRLELEQQLVVGHEEYRRVTHTEPQFRRAFAEVFRSRSLLFVGSSLTDQYLLNLFGEALEIFGSNPFPHYAFVLKDTTDPEFLRTRLNTFVYEYDDHRDLPDLLKELSTVIETTSARVRTWSYAVATSVRSTAQRRAADVHVVRGELPAPDPGECVTLGVSVGEAGQITLEGPTRDVLDRLGCLAQVRALTFAPGDRVLRVPGQPVFLFAVTTDQGRPDLRQYSRSITAVLDAVAATEFRMVRTRLPLRDQRGSWWARFIHSVGIFALIQQFFAKDFRQRFWLTEIIRAYGRWRRSKENAGLLQLSVHLTDPGILFDMSTGRIDPVELLMCDDLRFTIEVEHDASTLMAESYQCEDTMKLEALARELRILRSADPGSTPERWLVAVDPSPTGVPHVLSLCDSAALDTSLSELGVVPDSVLRFVRVPKLSVEGTPAAAPSAAPAPSAPTRDAEMPPGSETLAPMTKAKTADKARKPAKSPKPAEKPAT